MLFNFLIFRARGTWMAPKNDLALNPILPSAPETLIQEVDCDATIVMLRAKY
jgi:hypothetical protein